MFGAIEHACLYGYLQVVTVVPDKIIAIFYRRQFFQYRFIYALCNTGNRKGRELAPYFFIIDARKTFPVVPHIGKLSVLGGTGHYTTGKKKKKDTSHHITL